MTTDDAAARAANERLATKRLRADINAILMRWDPLSLKGLRGFDRAYEAALNPLLIMVKKDADKMEIARKLAEFLKDEWRLPPNNAKCVEIATKIHGLGAMFRGE
jgi:hypothetical protein